MIREGQIRVLTQSASVDTNELVSFLSSYAEKVTIDEFHPGPQASVDWFLPANVELVMNVWASHPFIGSFLGLVSAHLTSQFAKESLKKIAETFGEAILSKSAEGLWDRLLGVFHRSKEHNVAFSRAGKDIPVPPLRCTLGVPALGTLAPVKLQFVFTTELSDKDFHSAYQSVGNVIECVMKTLEEREAYEQRMTEAIAAGEMEQVTEMLESEHYIAIRHTTFTYVYRADEHAWVNANVLAMQPELERQLKILREALAKPVDASHEAINDMIADIQRQIEGARVR
jgi:hypothetical protein